MVDLSEIARLAGVSKMSVSRALRNHPGVSSATREKITEIACHIGYRPNPLLKIYQSNVRKRHPEKYQATIAFVETSPEASGWQRYAAFRRLFQGAVDRAESQGYRLERFWLREKNLTSERLANTLHARGIYGIIFHHLPRIHEPDAPLNFPFAGFACVAVGTPLLNPKLHFVGADNYGNLVLAWKTALKMGFDRIGMMLNKYNDARTEHRQAACFNYLQMHAHPRKRIPLYYILPGEQDRSEVWYQAHKPDVIIQAGEEQPPFLIKAKWSAKKPIPVIYLDYHDRVIHQRGVDQNHDMLGAAAIDVIQGQFARGERGVPLNPKTVLISGDWKDRSSL